MYPPKYGSPEQIPDEVIQGEFAKEDSIGFFARPFNFLINRDVCIGDLGWQLPLIRVLTLINVTPEELRPVFEPYARNPLPEKIEKFEDLAQPFPLDEKAFAAFARVIGKTMRIYRQHGDGENQYLFTAHPTGEIVVETFGERPVTEKAS